MKDFHDRHFGRGDAGLGPRTPTPRTLQNRMREIDRIVERALEYVSHCEYPDVYEDEAQHFRATLEQIRGVIARG